MSAADAIAIAGSGLVTSVGMDSTSSCAAIRAKIANPSPSGYMDDSGDLLGAHHVPFSEPLRGMQRLITMLCMAIDECLATLEPAERTGLPLLLCVAEQERPGRLADQERQLIAGVQQQLGMQFGAGSACFHGRSGVVRALAQARQMVYGAQAPRVLIASVDTLLQRATLTAYENEFRLLTPRNSNGFMPSESAGALLITRPQQAGQLCLTGLGTAHEPAHVTSDEPLRGDGLVAACKQALDDAGCTLNDIQYNIIDATGEQYHFKEASLAFNRLLKVRQEATELWHPAESIGHCGTALAIACLAVAQAAAAKGYAPGPATLLHFSDDAGARAAVVAKVS